MAQPHNPDIRIECIDKSACAQCGAVVDLTGKEAFSVVQCPRCQGRFTAPGTLGNLALLKILGKGQMGVTFKAHDRSLGRNVAVKVMRGSPRADRKAIDDFFSEARALGVLDHPNVAKIYTLVEDAECPYIVMELLEGGSMEKQFDKNRPMDEVRALEIGIGVAKALSAAHEVGLIHGDVKPGNIMLDEKGRAKLVDFGIARFGGGRTNEFDALGTPYYASPEQVLRTAVDFRTDIYSLGATLFHALTGAPPFPGTALKDVLAARLKAPAPNLRTVRPDLHEKTAAVVAKMLEASPKARQATYEDLRRDLEEAYAQAAGLEAPLTSDTPRRTGRWVLVGGLLLTVVAAGAMTLLLQQQPRNESPELPPTGQALPGPVMPPPARPTLTPGRAISQETDVTISCDTAEATIRYTLDGSEPTEASPVYQTSVRIAPGTTVKARAFAKGRQPSGVAGETYPEDQAVLADIVPLRTRANQAWTRVKGLDGQQGFDRLLDAAGTLEKNAEEIYQKGAYAAAGPLYGKLVTACEAIEKRQASRTAAKAAKEKLDAALQALGGQPKDQTPAWKGLADRREKADALYADGKFDEAASLWNKADQDLRLLLKESAQAAEKRFLDQTAKCDKALVNAFGGSGYAAVQAAALAAQKAQTQGDFLAALTNFNQASALLPRAELSARLRQNVQTVQSKVDQAAKLFKEQKLAEASAAIEDILKLAPYQPDAWTLRHQIASRNEAVLPLDGNPASATAIKAVLIPAGTFEFGPPTGSRKVTITKAFYLAQYEVTRGQFDLFVKAMVAADKAYKTQGETGPVMVVSKTGAWVVKKDKTPITWTAPGFTQADTHPVVCVTWKDAQDFCKWAGERSGATLRLPTEAEWEYACRAGTKTLFSFSPSNDLPEYANFADKSLLKTIAADDRNVNTAPVGTYKPNAWKLFDMHGNVLEWCEDWYQAPPPATDKDPHGPENGTLRAIRGGSWASPPVDCSSFARRGLPPTTPGTMVGFRVLATAVPDNLFAVTPMPMPSNPPPLPDVYASELTALPGSSACVANRSFSQAALKVAGLDYQQGMGLPSPATLILPVKPAFKRFVGIAGLDENQRAAKPEAALRCHVFFDDVEVAATPVLRYSALASWPVDIGIPDGVREIRLTVEEVAAAGTKPAGNINWVNVGFRNEAP